MRNPDPTNDRIVYDVASTAATESFDRDRPLWEYTLVEDLPDGKAAFVMKVHHSMTDGVGGIKLLLMLLDLERDPLPLGPEPDPLPLAGVLAVGGRDAPARGAARDGAHRGDARRARGVHRGQRGAAQRRRRRDVRGEDGHVGRCGSWRRHRRPRRRCCGRAASDGGSRRSTCRSTT